MYTHQVCANLPPSPSNPNREQLMHSTKRDRFVSFRIPTHFPRNSHLTSSCSGFVHCILVSSPLAGSEPKPPSAPPMMPPLPPAAPSVPPVPMPQPSQCKQMCHHHGVSNLPGANLSPNFETTLGGSNPVPRASGGILAARCKFSGCLFKSCATVQNTKWGTQRTWSVEGTLVHHANPLVVVTSDASGACCTLLHII